MASPRLDRNAMKVRTAAFTGLLLLSTWCVGADKSLPAGADQYQKFPEAIRKQLTRAYLEEIRDKEKAVALAVKGLAKASTPSAREQAKEIRDQAKADLQQLKDKNNPPFVGNWIDDCCSPDSFRNPGAKWKTGDIGVCDDGFRVVQVQGPETALMHRKFTDQLFLLKKVPTKGWTDDTVRSLPLTLWVTGTTSYQTATGTNTVIVVEPFDFGRYQKSVDE